MTDATAAPGLHRPVIVIFGAAVRPDGQPSRTLLRRVEAAFALGQSLDAPLYMPTGGVGRFGDAEAEVMAALLREWGVDPADIRPERGARDTLDSVRNVRALLGRHHQGPVYAATSAYHLPRCVTLLWLAGLRARPCPPPPALAAASWRKRWWWRLREVPALPWDALWVVLLRLLRRL